MIRILIAGFLLTWPLQCLCQAIDFKTTKARVTYEAATSWIDGVGPALSLTISIRGPIGPDTAILVQRYYDVLADVDRQYSELMNNSKRSTGFLVNVELDSPGGNIKSAIEIGRLLRAKEAHVLIPANALCASSCVFVLAGGATRYVEGKLGIHRPFMETPSRVLTADDVKSVATMAQEGLRAYFREMNVSERLADDMMMIPSNQIKWLTRQETAIYGLGIDDPVINETLALQQAQKYGLSRIEYEKRQQQAQKVCAVANLSECWDNIMKGARPSR